jgi:hypothetical protein
MLKRTQEAFLLHICIIIIIIIIIKASSNHHERYWKNFDYEVKKRNLKIIDVILP